MHCAGLYYNGAMSIYGAQLACYLGALQALQLGMVSFFRTGENRPANRLFALPMVLIALLLGLAAKRFSPEDLSSYPYIWVHVWGTGALLFSPLIYLYVRISVGGYRWRPRAALHFLPAALHLCLLTPLPFLDSAARSDLVQRYLELELYRSLIPGIRLGALQAFAYWLLCFFWVRRLERHIRDTASFSDREHLLWLKCLTSLLVVLLVMLALGRLVAFARVELIGVLAFASFLLVVNTLVMARPSLLQGVPSPLQLPPQETQAPEPTETRERTAQEHEQAAQTAQRLRALFERERPYLNDGLTLVEVAAALHCGRGHVSRVLNEVVGKSFHDYVNDFRIEAAQALLLDLNQAHLSVDGIALEVGFRSRSVFFTAFKKRTGLTPAAWRKARIG